MAVELKKGQKVNLVKKGTSLGQILINLIGNFYFGWKMFDEDWFERTLTAYGLESGVLATGLMLLRVVDPQYETQGQESGASSAALCYPWSLPYIMFGPALAFAVSPAILLGGSAALWLVFFVIARIFFWHPERKLSHIALGNNDLPRQNIGVEAGE